MDVKNIKKLLELILKAVGLAMGVATLVLSILGELQGTEAIILLSIGVIALAINALQE